MIVDSCRRRNEPPAPLRYLEDIGVQVGSAVKLIVATHWHDDHLSGLGEVYRACTSAAFASSIALGKKEFRVLVRALGRRPPPEGSGVDELASIFGQACVFKIAHHGSANGHLDAVWQRLLRAQVHAVLTPFSRSGLPSESDLSRIRGLTPKAFATGTPHLGSPSRRDAAVEKTLREAGVKRRALRSDMGHVRFRFPIGLTAPRVITECFGAAFAVGA